MKTLGLFTDEKDQKLYQELLMRTERYNTFKFGAYLLRTFGIVAGTYASILALATLLSMFFSDSKWFNNLWMVVEPIIPPTWGETPSKGFLVVAVVMFFIVVVVTGFKYHRSL